MKISARAKEIPTSVTLRLNDEAQKLSSEGHRVFNFTAGQLPDRPMPSLVESLVAQTKFLKSFQYAPVPGVAIVKEKFLDDFFESRNMNQKNLREAMGCLISNGGKHSLYNLLGSLIDPGDEVILLAPYWVSYPEMVKLWGGEVVTVNSSQSTSFTPTVTDISNAITAKTRAIIINSPNNPSGIHYDENWMQSFAELMEQHSEVAIVSDEIYYKLNYFDPKPTYFYQYRPQLLQRTAIVDGISKSLACTGLRIGTCIADKAIISAMGKIQAQTTSGANSLVQQALTQIDLKHQDQFLAPVKDHLRANANTLRKLLRENQLSHLWYQTLSAFYFMLDLSQTPVLISDLVETLKGRPTLSKRKIRISGINGISNFFVFFSAAAPENQN
jgi:aspartate aminotransferase